MITLKPSLFAFAAAALSVTASAQTAAPAPVAPSPAVEQAAGPIAPVDLPTISPSPAMDPVASTTSIGTSAPLAEIGQPINKRLGLQPQVTPTGQQAEWMHNAILMPVMVGISLLVLGLMVFVSARFRRKANPVASKTTHNTIIEVVWTLLPVLILVVIAVPSISLLAAQFTPAPKDAVTLKAIGYQWNWGYEYPDHGISEFTSNMLPEQASVASGTRFRNDADGPRLLAVDNRVVLPVNTPIRLLTTGSDVIHAWAIPAFWIKMDAIPGRINETSFTVEKTGVYYGQCSELCGIKHSAMPIAVEVVSKEDFAKWVRAKGGKMPGDADAAATAPVTPAVTVAPIPATSAAPVAATK